MSALHPYIFAQKERLQLHIKEMQSTDNILKSNTQIKKPSSLFIRFLGSFNLNILRTQGKITILYIIMLISLMIPDHLALHVYPPYTQQYPLSGIPKKNITCSGFLSPYCRLP